MTNERDRLMLQLDTDFTTTDLNAIKTLAEQAAGSAADCGRKLLIGYFDDEGDLPVAWISAESNGTDATVSFQTPAWLDILFDGVEDEES